MKDEQCLGEVSQWRVLKAVGLGGLQAAVHEDCAARFAFETVKVVLPDDLPFELLLDSHGGKAPEWLARSSTAALARVARQCEAGGLAAFGLAELASCCQSGHWVAVSLQSPTQVKGALLFKLAHHPDFDPSLQTWVHAYSRVAGLSFSNTLIEEQFRSEGYRDPLTGAYLRRYFIDRMMQEASRARRGAWPVCCLVLDIDRLNQINETHGRQVGDQVLREVAMRLMSQLRQGEILARLDGGRFAIALSQATSRAGSIVAERLRLIIERDPIDYGAEAGPLRVTASFGVSDQLAMPSGDLGELAESLLARAGNALAHAKDAGRNCVISAVN